MSRLCMIQSIKEFPLEYYNEKLEVLYYKFLDNNFDLKICNFTNNSLKQ